MPYPRPTLKKKAEPPPSGTLPLVNASTAPDGPFRNVSESRSPPIQASFDLEVDSSDPSDSDSDDEYMDAADDEKLAAERQDVVEEEFENGKGDEPEEKKDAQIETSDDDQIQVKKTTKKRRFDQPEDSDEDDFQVHKSTKKRSVNPPSTSVEKKAKMDAHSSSAQLSSPVASIPCTKKTALSVRQDVGVTKQRRLNVNTSVKLSRSNDKGLNSGSDIHSTQNDQVTLLRNEIQSLRQWVEVLSKGVKAFVDDRLSDSEALLKKNLDEVKELRAVLDLSLCDRKKKKFDAGKQAEIDIPFFNFVFSEDVLQVIIEKYAIGHVSSTSIEYQS